MFWTDFSALFYWLYIIVIGFFIILVISKNKSPHKTMLWILAFIILPLISLILFFFFGQNYRKQKIFSQKGLEDFSKYEEISSKQFDYIDTKQFAKNEQLIEHKKLIRLLLKNNKAILTTKNKVQILNNGEETFRIMFEEIRKAKHHIHLEYYILHSDKIGNELADILIEKVKKGVEVRIIYDHVGSWEMHNTFPQKLRKHGIEVACFMPVRLPFLTSKVNYRNHRKIAVIDGKTGFVGGINIADHYLYGKKNIPFWRDTHLRIEGESVNTLQLVFATDWFFLTNKLLNQTVYFPKPRISETIPVQIVTSGPDSDWANIMQAFFLSITSAKKNIYISTPYFLPNESILTALKTAALSGIDVKILLPGYKDSKLVYYATLSFVKELLEAGINVYLYRKGFNHSKLIIIDNEFCSVGTANLDYRSFSQNFEINALIYSPQIATELAYWFEEDLKESELIDSQKWKKRSKVEKFKASFTRIFSPML